MSIPTQSANQRMKGQDECSALMALGRCIDAVEDGRAEDEREFARTVARMTFILNPKLRKN